ncbi:class I tRNA ligase family protein [Patescibacteria group bacterium]
MNFAENEEEILKYWKKNWIFHKTLKKDAPKGEFVFYEGPPTANGKPGIHHVEARAFKDLIPRYKTMQGYHVERKAGWDTQGLPVELEVEKKLGLKKKKDVEEYGIGKFNQKCKQSVWDYKEDWEKMTERIGFWVDMTDPYVTYENDYIESLWWIINEAHKKGLLYQGHKVIPNCPRCGTALSSHEVAQGYKNVKEESVYIKFKIKNRKNDYILAWTTTPWTLPGNIALAVGEDIDYVEIMQNDEFYYLAKNLLGKIEGEYEILEELKGKELVGLEYEPLFPGIITEKHENYENAYKVYPADFVSTEDGTGVVHTAVMYGIEDYELGEKIGLPKVHTVNLDGTFNELVPKWNGKFVKDTEKDIIKDLKERKLLYKTEEYAHDYPFCWRCDTPLIYYAKDSWFFKMSSLRDDLIKNNSEINWIPAHTKEGRFGEWIREVKDWSISRERYWGTPIPVWKCGKCKEMKVVGSVGEIRENLGGYNNLFIMRHGQSENNVICINNSMPEVKKYPLTEKGRGEAKEAAIKYKNKKIDMIFSSPIMRTKETAEIISKELGIPVIFDERIREMDLGEFNNKACSEFHKVYPTRMSWAKNTSHGVESGEQIKKRVEEFLSEISDKYKNKNIVIVAHAGVCQILFGETKGVELQESYKISRI